LTGAEIGARPETLVTDGEFGAPRLWRGDAECTDDSWQLIPYI